MVSEQFSDFIDNYKQKLKSVFQPVKQNEEEYKLTRGIDKDSFSKIMEATPLSAFIPSEFGGRGALTHEALAMLEASSYQSLPLSLMMGINGALFLQPVANYAQEEVKGEIFRRFLEENKMGGLMITEPDFGSDALKMQTSFIRSEDGSYQIKGLKHWAGLTGLADYWLITARNQDENGELGRDISFFIHDSRNGGINVQEMYPNLGLFMLPYGKNKIDIRVDASHKLEPNGTGITMMLDILHRSRLQFPGMAMGFLKRIMEEAMEHCKTRLVGGQSLFNYDQVKQRISELQSYFTVCSAMCHFTGSNVPLDKNTSRMDVEANAVKSVITDFMQKASQSLLQLMGAKGYRLDSIAGRSVIDSRPFQIFEGSNDILYQQISESVFKAMRKMKESNLYIFLSDYKLTEQSSEYFKDVFNFEVELKMPQRKFVELGRALGRVISMEFTLKLAENGFNRDLVDNTITNLQAEVRSLMCSFHETSTATVVDDYVSDSSWIELVGVHAS